MGERTLRTKSLTKIQYQKSQIRRTKMAPVPSGEHYLINTSTQHLTFYITALRRWLGALIILFNIK